MRGKRAKILMEKARMASLDGSVIKSEEYKRLKKKHVHPHYAPVTVLYPTLPDVKFKGESVILRKVKYPFKDGGKRNKPVKKTRQKGVRSKSSS